MRCHDASLSGDRPYANPLRRAENEKLLAERDLLLKRRDGLRRRVAELTSLELARLDAELKGRRAELGNSLSTWPKAVAAAAKSAF